MAIRSRLFRLVAYAFVLIVCWYAFAAFVLPPPARRLVEPLGIRTRLELCLDSAAANAKAENRHIKIDDVVAAVATDPIFERLRWNVEINETETGVVAVASTDKSPVIVYPSISERVLLLRGEVRMDWPIIRSEVPNHRLQLTGDARDGESTDAGNRPRGRPATEP